MGAMPFAAEMLHPAASISPRWTCPAYTSVVWWRGWGNRPDFPLFAAPLCDFREVSISHTTMALRLLVCRWMCILHTPGHLSTEAGHLKQILHFFPLCFLLVILHIRFAFYLVNRPTGVFRHLLSVNAGAVEQRKPIACWFVLWLEMEFTGRVGFIPLTPSYHCWSDATLTCQHSKHISAARSPSAGNECRRERCPLINVLRTCHLRMDLCLGPSASVCAVELRVWGRAPQVCYSHNWVLSIWHWMVKLVSTCPVFDCVLEALVKTLLPCTPRPLPRRNELQSDRSCARVWSDTLLREALAGYMYGRHVLVHGCRDGHARPCEGCASGCIAVPSSKLKWKG